MTLRLGTHVLHTITSDPTTFHPCQQQIASGNKLLLLIKNENHLKTNKEVGMLLQKRANTSGVGISNIMRISVYVLTTTPTNYTYTF